MDRLGQPFNWEYEFTACTYAAMPVLGPKGGTPGPTTPPIRLPGMMAHGIPPEGTKVELELTPEQKAKVLEVTGHPRTKLQVEVRPELREGSITLTDEQVRKLRAAIGTEMRTIEFSHAAVTFV